MQHSQQARGDEAELVVLPGDSEGRNISGKGTGCDVSLPSPVSISWNGSRLNFF